MRLNKLIIPILLVLFVSCNSNDSIGLESIPDINNGSITATLNEDPWGENAEVSFKYLNPISKFILIGRVKNKYSRETFSITGFLPILEIQNIRSVNTADLGETSARYTTLNTTGDAITSSYVLDTTALNNFIHITKYDSTKEEIEGIFNVTLIIDFNSKVEEYPQTLEFTDGKFTAKVERGWFECRVGKGESHP